jgi:hypothetical protein
VLSNERAACIIIVCQPVPIAVNILKRLPPVSPTTFTTVPFACAPIKTPRGASRATSLSLPPSLPPSLLGHPAAMGLPPS